MKCIDERMYRWPVFVLCWTTPQMLATLEFLWPMLFSFLQKFVMNKYLVQKRNRSGWGSQSSLWSSFIHFRTLTLCCFVLHFTRSPFFDVLKKFVLASRHVKNVLQMQHTRRGCSPYFHHVSMDFLWNDWIGAIPSSQVSIRSNIENPWNKCQQSWLNE